MKILIAGAGGYLGGKTASFFSEAEIFSPVRDRKLTGKTHFFVDYEAGKIEIEKAPEFDAVINFCGENLASQSWTPEFKQRILSGRVIPASRIANWIAEGKIRTRLLISMSGIGFYGNRGEEILTEDSNAGNDFLARVCKDWERPILETKIPNCRKIILRTGAVLCPGAGLLKKLKLPFSLGLGGKQGNGKQYLSWIAEQDFLRILRFVMENPQISGVLNVCGPENIRNATFAKSYAKFLGRPCIFPAPGIFLKLLFGELAECLILSGQRAKPEKLENSGFQFQFPNVDSYFQSLKQ